MSDVTKRGAFDWEARPRKISGSRARFRVIAASSDHPIDGNSAPLATLLARGYALDSIHEWRSRVSRAVVSSVGVLLAVGACCVGIADDRVGEAVSAPRFRHELRLVETASAIGDVVTAGTLFNELLLSWNVDCPPSAGFRVELRVGRAKDGLWTPWLHVGDWGAGSPTEKPLVECPLGKVDVDYFTSKESFERAQCRVVPVGAGTVRVRRLGFCFSDTLGKSRPAAGDQAGAERSATDAWSRRLTVPFRSQRTEHETLASKICSPTSVAMVLEYRGVSRTTADVAARVFDPAHGIYGNWPRAVQAAYSFGVPGYLARYSEWSEVERLIARGQPLVISVRVKKGELDGAPYGSTDGHLLVLAGFDRDGNVLVCDPAATPFEGGERAYRRDQLARVWMGLGGTAYVLLERE